MFCEGDRSDFIVVIVEGRVKIVVTTAEGGESLLGIRGPGALVGEPGIRPGTAPRDHGGVEPLTVRLFAADESGRSSRNSRKSVSSSYVC